MEAPHLVSAQPGRSVDDSRGTGSSEEPRKRGRVVDKSLDDLYLVFELVDTDLNKLLLSPQYLTTLHVQTFLYQILLGLNYLHSANVIHR